RGHSLLMDEIAINEAAYYEKSSNCIGGLCRDYAGLIDIKLTDYETIANASEAIHGDNPLCHYGKEATVGAIAAFSGNHYSPLPILVSLTCKTEKADDAEILIERVLDCWRTNPNGETRFGPIWSFPTDSDSTRRLACHSLFMKYDLGSSSMLYETLLHLPGLNLKFRAHLVTMDFNPKHLIKR
ncbi:hypothetical protein PAXINDRAFT_38042, partial [Paxillus involutus ATCC 200175]